MDEIWNVILYKLDGNKLVNPENNPSKSGQYLCTCVQIRYGEEQNRYLHVMEYDADEQHWHDCGNKNGTSHYILAWTDKIDVCNFADYNYVAGGYFLVK